MNNQSTNSFRCKAHEVLYQNILKSYKNEKFTNSIINSGGRASGKSHTIIDNMVFWLPEINGDVGLIITYSAEHKSTTALLVAQKLLSHGYSIIQKHINSSDIVYMFGNNNYIFIRSIQTNTIAQRAEKMKNFELMPRTQIKFLAFKYF